MGILSLILVALAAVLDACQDTLAHHWNQSIFSKMGSPTSFWGSPENTWQRKYTKESLDKILVPGNTLELKKNIIVQFSDAWHTFKTIKIIILLSVILLPFYFGLPINSLFGLVPDNNFLRFTINLLLLGTIWNFTFSRFYNHILIKKSK